MRQNISDLIERLRYHGNHCLDREGEQSRTMLEAAAEIDRLRTDIEILRLHAQSPDMEQGEIELMNSTRRLKS